MLGFMVGPTFGDTRLQDDFFYNYPYLERYVRFFAPTSIEREVLLVKDNYEMAYKLFLSGYDPENSFDLESETPDEVKLKLEQYMQGEIDAFRVDLNAHVGGNGLLVYVYFQDDEKQRDTVGWIVIKEGIVSWEETMNIVYSESLDLNNYRREDAFREIRSFSERQNLFFQHYPKLEKFIVHFAATSAERELIEVRDKIIGKYSYMSEMLERGKLAIPGVVSKDDLVRYLDELKTKESSRFEDYKNNYLGKDGMLVWVHFRDEEKMQDAKGYIVIKDGILVFDDTINVDFDSKIPLDQYKVGSD